MPHFGQRQLLAQATKASSRGLTSDKWLTSRILSSSAAPSCPGPTLLVRFPKPSDYHLKSFKLACQEKNDSFEKKYLDFFDYLF